MDGGQTIGILRDLPRWKPGQNQEESILPEEVLAACLPGLREVAFEMGDLFGGLDDPESIDFLRVHAFRNLAAAGAAEDVEPVLDYVYELEYEDPDLSDAINADFPWLMARFGAVAVQPLSDWLSNLGEEEHHRVRAASALIVLAEADCEADTIWALFQKLVRTGALHRTVNGIMLAGLASHPGAASPEFVLETYDANVVDVTACGDREDLELKMGLRKERDTKPPKLEELEEQRQADYFRATLGPLPADATPAEVLDYFLTIYRRPSAAEDAAMVHALLSGLIVSPQMAPPSAITQIVWNTRKADGSGMPIWAGMEELQLFSEALMTFYNDIMESFDQGTYAPMTTEVDEEGEDGEELFSLESWADGLMEVAEYLRASQGENTFTDELQGVADELATEVLVYPLMDGERVEIASMNAVDFLEASRNEQQGQPPTGFGGLSPSDADSIFAPGPGPLPASGPVTRDQPKVGRNDPCPCGSGKKYKRCCAN